MTYQEAIRARVPYRAVMAELSAHGLDRCEFAQCEDSGDIIEKATGEVVTSAKRGGFCGGELLGWLGH